MRKYRDKEWLATKYIDEELSLQDMADICGSSKSTINRWMKKYNIERRTPNKDKILTLKERPDGYIEFGGEGEKVLLHRLAAVVEHGFEAVKNNDVHHISGCVYDNRPCNVKPVSKEEHGRYHANQRWNNEQTAN